MKRIIFLIPISALLFVQIVFAKSFQTLSSNEILPFATEESAQTKHKRGINVFGKLSPVFVPNAGQTHSEVLYYTRGSDFGVYLTHKEVVFTFLAKQSNTQPDMTMISFSDHGMSTHNESNVISFSLEFLNPNPKMTIEGRQNARGKINYFKGNDPRNWYRGLPSYRSIIYKDLWSGVDVAFHFVKGQLKYDFVIKPNAKIEDIRLAYRGIENLALDESGDLFIKTSLGTIKEKRPVSYQEIDGKKIDVTSQFKFYEILDSNQVYGFEIGVDYNSNHQLTIDPGLEYSTFLGGTSTDVSNSIAIDSYGNKYITGFTSSADFPFTTGAYTANNDIFVAKLDNNNENFLYITILGGSQNDTAESITVDEFGRAYLTGSTASTDFPTTSGAYSTSPADGRNAFVMMLDHDGENLLYSTYLGGDNWDKGSDIKLGPSCRVYVLGFTNNITTEPDNFPTTTGAYQTTPGGNGDAFIAIINPDVTVSPAIDQLVYSTYLGGSAQEVSSGIAVGQDGRIYVAGTTGAGFPPPTANARQSPFLGGKDVFCSIIDPSELVPADQLVYSTLLGGSDDEQSADLALDVDGNILLTGFTKSDDFDITPGAYATSASDNIGETTALSSHNFDVFVTKINPSLAILDQLVYSTYLGGTGTENSYSLTTDLDGNAYIIGVTESFGSTEFPTTSLAYSNTHSGDFDIFVSKITPSLLVPPAEQLLYSTYLGGSERDVGRGIALDPSGKVYITGNTQSDDFPTTSDADDDSHNGIGTWDAFIAKLGIPVTENWPWILSVAPNVGIKGATYDIAISGGGFSEHSGLSFWHAKRQTDFVNVGLSDFQLADIHVNSLDFISSRRLEANITVSNSALSDGWHVEFIGGSPPIIRFYYIYNGLRVENPNATSDMDFFPVIQDPFRMITIEQVFLSTSRKSIDYNLIIKGKGFKKGMKLFLSAKKPEVGTEIRISEKEVPFSVKKVEIQSDTSLIAIVSTEKKMPDTTLHLIGVNPDGGITSKEFNFSSVKKRPEK